MWRNYFRVGLRNLRRNRTHSAINVVGLSLAVAALLLFTLFLRRELVFDRHHQKLDRIVRVVITHEGREAYNSYVPAVFAEEVAPRIPGFERVVRLLGGRNQVRRDQLVTSRETIFAEEGFFELFDVPLRSGDPSLHGRPDAAYVSPDLAMTYFGRTDGVVGEEIEVSYRHAFHRYRIAGVLEEWPEESTFQGDLLLPYQPLYEGYREQITSSPWHFYFSQTWALLEPGADREAMTAEMRRLTLEENIAQTPEDERKPIFALQPFSTVHLDLLGTSPWPTREDGRALRILAGIVAVILLLAAINFTTLSVGRLSTRLREVGLRKTLGARRADLFAQHLVETVAVVALAVLTGLLLAELLLPVLNGLLGTSLGLEPVGFLLPALLLIGLLVVLLAGGYPAWAVSTLPVVGALKEQTRMGGQGLLRRLLVGTQLAVSMGLVGVMVAMYVQLGHVIALDPGYDSEGLVALPAASREDLALQVRERLEGELGSDPAIEGFATSAASFGRRWHRIGWEAAEEGGEDVSGISMNIVSPDFLDLLGVEVVRGRGFDRDRPADRSDALLVNEAFVRKMSWEEPLGRQLPTAFGTARVVGVLEDFHFEDLRREIAPLVLVQSLDQWDGNSFMINQGGPYHAFVLVKLRPGDRKAALGRIGEVWNEQVPDAAFDPRFVEQAIEAQYRDARRWRDVVTGASGVALLIAMLGLVGLTTLQVARRTREIGIRTVLGARPLQIVRLLAAELVLLVGLASVVALPVSWWLMHRWLEQFAYRVPASPLFQLGAGVLVLLLTLCVAGGLGLRAARRDPVQTLRQE